MAAAGGMKPRRSSSARSNNGSCAPPPTPMNCCGTSRNSKAAWPERVLTMQRNWIGRSEGAEVDFTIEGYGPVRVFTTRIDTIYGATCLILAPEHEIVATKLGPEAQARRRR